MPFFILSIIVQIILIGHVIKTGRNRLWIIAIGFLPLAGSLAYVLIELLPDLLGSNTARKTLRNVQKTLDPEHDLRHQSELLEVVETSENLVKLGDELYERGRFSEAQTHYEKALKGIEADNPHLLLKLAQTQFETEDFATCRHTLENLIAKKPDFRSPHGHLLYARTLAALNENNQAEEEFATLTSYWGEPEGKYRFAAWLAEQARNEEAKKHLDELLNVAKHSAKYYQNLHHEWIQAAKRLREQV